jgi:hypothetical protein
MVQVVDAEVNSLGYVSWRIDEAPAAASNILIRCGDCELECSSDSVLLAHRVAIQIVY